MNVNESVRETENIRRFAELVKDQKKYIGFEVNIPRLRLYTIWIDLLTAVFIFAEYFGSSQTVGLRSRCCSESGREGVFLDAAVFRSACFCQRQVFEDSDDLLLDNMFI
jgi:hypothetical protein